MIDRKLSRIWIYEDQTIKKEYPWNSDSIWRIALANLEATSATLSPPSGRLNGSSSSRAQISAYFYMNKHKINTNFLSLPLKSAVNFFFSLKVQFPFIYFLIININFVSNRSLPYSIFSKFTSLLDMKLLTQILSLCTIDLLIFLKRNLEV